MSEEQKKSKFRKCYEPHLRDYPDCFEECGCDTCESPLASQIDKIYSQPPEGSREGIANIIIGKFPEETPWDIADKILSLIYPEPKPCPHCNGKGEHDSLPAPMFGERVKCAYCNGTGKQPAEQPERPQIVCLTGSTRFKENFEKLAKELVLTGHIVLTVHCFQHLEWPPINENQIVILEDLQKKQIDLADEVFVLNVGKYIGESTRSEIEYATKHGKPIKYLEAING